MDLEEAENGFTFSNRTSSCFSNFFQEEINKMQQKNPKDLNNIFNYNSHPITNNNNIDKNFKIQPNNEYPLGLNKDHNFLYFNMNKNQILNNINNSENQSRFLNYFKNNENMINNPFVNINNLNNNIINNNINNNNLKKDEKYQFNCIYDKFNNNIGLNNNNYINYYDKNNINYYKKNKFEFNDYQNNINSNINHKDLNDINKNNDLNNVGINKIIIPNNILNRNADYEEFLNYINNLNTPLIKFLCTKKGISEMENYLNYHKKNNIEILIYLLNKEGLTKLMKNKFGNYFIQEIIKDANYPEIKLILELISQNFVEISESNSGTHVLQTLLDKVNNFELRNIVLKSIENKELEMAFNNNATYVLQKIIGIIPDYERLNTNEIIINNIINLALDSECVFIVEKFISTITIKENKEKIKEIICQNCLQLANSPFGNYLIQYLFQIWKDNDIDKINNIVIDNASFLANQRYSSNIIEKAIETFDNKYKPKLIRSLSLGGNILEIIKNQYGHYVLNKAVKYMDEKLKNEIETKLNNQMPEMTKKEKTKSKKFIANLKKNGKNNKKNNSKK